MKKTISFLFTIVFTMISCSKSDNGLANRVPETFNLIGITNGTTGVDLLPNFIWTAAVDPDGDPVTYDLYIDSNENPTILFAENISVTNYQAEERLSLTNQYYWKVVAKDNKGNTTESEEIYSFTTRDLNIPNTPITVSAAFAGRLDHTTAVFDNKMWVIGGSDGYLSYKNDVWYSANGSTWKKATSHADFSERYRHTTTVFDNKLWVIGGFDGDNNNDVWYSDDGVTWVQATSNAGFSKRNHHTTVVFDNKLWVIGGITDGIVGSRKNDVWYSTDGIVWVQATANAAFPKRAVHTSTVFDNKLWVIGGYDGSRKNDVWHTTDGDSWVKATDNATFSKRSDHTTSVFNNRLWVIGGFDGSNKNDVWFSADGSTWTQATSNAAFSKRNAHTTTVFGERLWVIGGFDGLLRNDVWAMD